VYQEVQHSLGTVVLVSSLTGSLMLILGLFLGYLLSSRLARYCPFIYCKPFLPSYTFLHGYFYEFRVILYISKVCNFIFLSLKAL
jgi:hypothetical protein